MKYLFSISLKGPPTPPTPSKWEKGNVETWLRPSNNRFDIFISGINIDKPGVDEDNLSKWEILYNISFLHHYVSMTIQPHSMGMEYK